jgi:hypothetical protein
MKHDQWFEPGDKVMRVGSNPDNATFIPKNKSEGIITPAYNKVLCVEDFWEGPQYNVVIFVGGGGWRYANGMKVGWPASAFRKVQEIKLCLKAVSRSKHKEKIKQGS